MAARRAYNELIQLYKQHQLVTFATVSLEYDTTVYMSKRASQCRQSANVGLMQHNNNICVAALNQYQVAFPGVAQGEFTALELANLRECNRMMNVSRDMERADQQMYLRSVQARQQATQTMTLNRQRLLAQNDWQAYSSLLRDIAKFASEEAATLNRKRTPYDNLMSVHAFGMSYAEIDIVDRDLSSWWPVVRDTVRARQQATERRLGPVLQPSVWVPKSEEEANEKTEKLLREVLQLVGFDWTRGRIDPGENPMTSPCPFDTRVVYRRNQRDPFMALVECFHETGHAAVEQGVPKPFWHLPVGNTECKALHEGHSHWMEMFVLRHPQFAEVVSSLLTDVYGPDPAFDPDNLRRHFKAVDLPSEKAVQLENQTASSKRDDLTLLPSIIMRSKLERELVEGITSIRDLPARHVALAKEYLDMDVSVEKAQRILMNDPMWGQGVFGYVPVYTNGVLYAAQFNRALVSDVGTDTLQSALTTGVVKPLMGWFDANVWSHGHMFETQKELVEAATKAPVDSSAWKAFILERYEIS